MAETDIFGPLLNIQDVPRAVEDHLKTWIDTYLNAVERDNGIALQSYARPQSYQKVNLLAGIPSEDMSPTIIIVTRGDNGRPERAGKEWSLGIDVGVASVTSSYEGDGAREVAGAHCAAIVGCLLHKRNLGGQMNGNLRVESWDGVRLDDLSGSGEEQRTRAIIRLEFTIRLNGIVWSSAGPPDPDDPVFPEPPTPWPTVETTTTNIDKRSIQEDLT